MTSSEMCDAASHAEAQALVQAAQARFDASRTWGRTTTSGTAQAVPRHLVRAPKMRLEEDPSQGIRSTFESIALNTAAILPTFALLVVLQNSVMDLGVHAAWAESIQEIASRS